MQNNVPLSTADSIGQATIIHEPWLKILRIAWVLLAVISLTIIIAAVPGYTISLEAQTKLIDPTGVPSVLITVLNIGILVASIAAASLSLFLAWVIFRQKSNEIMPVYLSFFLVLYGISVGGPLEATYPFWPILSDFEFGLIIASLLGPAFITLFVLFPDGQFVPSWSKWLILFSISIVPISYSLEASSFTVIDKPIFLVGAGIAVITLVLGMYAQIFRYRNVSDQSERQQTKWVIYGITLWFLIMAVSSVPYAQVQQLPPGSLIPWWHQLNKLVYLISISLLPLSLTIAVMRYRLYDIDIIINRSLVYGSLTITTMGIYVFIVGYLGNLFQAINQSTLAFMATGLVALIFQPLRERLQRGVNRLMFGERDDPLAVLNSLSKRLEAASEPEAILPSIVDTVGQTLKLPYVAIEVKNGQATSVVAESGDPRPGIEKLPLIHQSEMVGELVFAPRSPHEDFSEAEYELLRNIARQTGAAVHAAKLTSDLRRSRQQLVSAREEERRRLRRDLHDGLGPTLASLTLKIDNARNQLTRDPPAADRLLVETKNLIQETLADIRRLVFDLRPPTLDELGLVAAIRTFVDQQDLDSLRVMISTDGELQNLPAAVDVAAYRIALEGITNVIRHARASSVVLNLSIKRESLVLEISDDGRGLPDPIPIGVGITSMRERAEELGGQLLILPQDKGTLLQAYLPC